MMTVFYIFKTHKVRVKFMSFEMVSFLATRRYCFLFVEYIREFCNCYTNDIWNGKLLLFLLLFGKPVNFIDIVSVNDLLIESNNHPISGYLFLIFFLPKSLGMLNF